MLTPWGLKQRVIQINLMILLLCFEVSLTSSGNPTSPLENTVSGPQDLIEQILQEGASASAYDGIIQGWCSK